MELTFQVQKQGDDIQGILADGSTFNPLTSIGDIIHCVAEKNTDQAFIQYSVECFNQIFKTNYSSDENKCFGFYEKMQDLKNKIENNNLFTLAELEKLKSFYDVRFRLDVITVEVENGFPEPLRFGFCDSQNMLDSIDNENHCYTYICYSMTDVIFAILHYLLLNDYKFRKCEHCEKYFATLTLKQKYCMRNSPLTGYTHLDCATAVDHALKAIKRRRKYVKEYLKTYYSEVEYSNSEVEYSNSKAGNIFVETVDKYIYGMEKNVAVLTQLKYITSKEYVKKHLYHKDIEKELNKYVVKK